MSTAELRALGEMWRGWSGIPRGTHPGGWGEYRLECRISGFARQDAEQVRNEWETHLAGFGARVGAYDQDTLEIIGPELPASRPFDVGLWGEVIRAAAIEGMCVMLRLHVRGATDGVSTRGAPRSTLVLFGRSSGGRFLAKAVWAAVSGDKTEDIYHKTDWPHEKLLLNAFDVFRHVEALPPAVPGSPLSFQCFDAFEAAATASALRALLGPSVPVGANGPTVWAVCETVACAQAASYARFFRSTRNPLFLTPGQAWLATVMTRMWVELPADRSPGRFAVRLGIPLGLCGAFVLAIVSSDPAQVAARTLLSVPAAGALCLAARIAFKKIQLIDRVRRRMCSWLRRHYSQPSSFAPVDLTLVGLTEDPSVPKYSREIQAAGGEHLGDFRIVARRAPGNGFRLYRLPSDHTVAAVIFMTRTDKYNLFPALPILACKTRFEDGHAHGTSTGRGDRKLRMPRQSGTCIRDAGPDVILAAHQAAVRKLEREGRKPAAPPADAAAVLALDQAEADETRAFYQSRVPYSWGDAVHWAFNLRRRCYRPVEPVRNAGAALLEE